MDGHKFNGQRKGTHVEQMKSGRAVCEKRRERERERERVELEIRKTLQYKREWTLQKCVPYVACTN